MCDPSCLLYMFYAITLTTLATLENPVCNSCNLSSALVHLYTTAQTSIAFSKIRAMFFEYPRQTCLGSSSNIEKLKSVRFIYQTNIKGRLAPFPEEKTHCQEDLLETVSRSNFKHDLCDFEIVKAECLGRISM